MMTFRHLGQLGFLLDFGGTKVGVGIPTGVMRQRLGYMVSYAVPAIGLAYLAAYALYLSRSNTMEVA